MSKEEYYTKIKRHVYRKFDELEVSKRNDGNDIFLHYNNDEYAKILIQKNSGYVYYYSGFRNKIINPITLKIVDFEILLKQWVEDTFKMKVIDTYSCGNYIGPDMLKIPPK